MLVFFSKYIETGIGVYPFFEDFFIHVFFYSRLFFLLDVGRVPTLLPQGCAHLVLQPDPRMDPQSPEGRTCGREGAPGDLLDLQVVRAAALATGDALAMTEVRPPPSFHESLRRLP